MATVAHAAGRQQPASGRLPSPTTPEVDAIGALPVHGTLIPQAWYTALTLPSGRPDLVAITLLADIGSNRNGIQFSCNTFSTRQL